MAEENIYQLAEELLAELGIDTSDLDPPHLSDVGNAKMLRLLHGENLRYCQHFAARLATGRSWPGPAATRPKRCYSATTRRPPKAYISVTGVICHLQRAGHAATDGHLFELACKLSVRAARIDHHINLGKQYGFNAAMAFQIYDDYCDLLKARGRPWEASASGDLPNSLRALKRQLDSGGLITEEDCARTLSMAGQYLCSTEITVALFPGSKVKPLLHQLPRFCRKSVGKESEGVA